MKDFYKNCVLMGLNPIPITIGVSSPVGESQKNPQQHTSVKVANCFVLKR